MINHITEVILFLLVNGVEIFRIWSEKRTREKKRVYRFRGEARRVAKQGAGSVLFIEVKRHCRLLKIRLCTLYPIGAQHTHIYLCRFQPETVLNPSVGQLINVN